MQDLAGLLRNLTPRLKPGTYVYATMPGNVEYAPLRPLASFREDEGTTLVVDEATAVAAGLPIHFRAAWITLEVHSDLQAVGLTAAVSKALGDAGISCNIIAAVHHDHIFVPAERAAQALDCLQALQENCAGNSCREHSS